MTSSSRTPEVAIVVPTRNSQATLRACLESVRAQTIPCTLVAVDNGSTDRTPPMANELADLFLDIGPERSAQRNAGAAAGSLAIVGFNDSDMVLSPTVAAEAAAAIMGGTTSAVVPEETVREGFWASVSTYEHSFYEASPTIEAPRFFPRCVFEDVGGFDEAMIRAEGWDLGLRTAEAGPRSRINANIIHNEGHVRYFNTCSKKAYYAPGVALFIKKHGIRSLTDISGRPWLHQPRALARPFGIGLLALKIGQAIAMMAAMSWTLLGRRLNLPGRPTMRNQLTP